MTATLNDVTSRKRKPDPSAEELAAAELVRLAKAQGLSLTGPDGLLKQLTKTVLETALNEEMTEHLGYGKHEVAGAGGGNVRNGSRAKTVLTDASGHVRRGRQHERHAHRAGVHQSLPRPATARTRPRTLARPEHGAPAPPRRVRLHHRHLADGTTLPLCRQGYGGSANRWGFAIYLVTPAILNGSMEARPQRCAA